MIIEKYRGTEIRIEDNVPKKESVLEEIKMIIDERLKTPIIAFLYDDEEYAHLRYANKFEVEKFNETVPHIDVELDDCIGQIWLPLETDCSKLSKEDIESAKKEFWCSDFGVWMWGQYVTYDY